MKYPEPKLFKPRNPKKYKGDPTKIIYRSHLEFTIMFRLDGDPNVVWWQSEEVIVPYKSPIDNKWHRYYPDFMYNTGNKTYMLEIKPLSQTRAPPIKKTSNKYIKEVMTWGVNQAKWEAAEKYCKDHNYEFKILTEQDLGIKY